MQDAMLLHPLAENDQLDLVNHGSAAARGWDEHLQHYQQQKQQYEKLLEDNAHWQQKFSEQDTSTALALAQKQEPLFLSF